MNTLVSIINAVRENCDVSWLTPSQLDVYERLKSGFEHQRVLNVFGAAGVGKTVLAWVMEREGYGKYCPSIDNLTTGHRRLLVDNLSSTHKPRRLTDNMGDLRVNQLVLITQARLDDDFPGFEIKLTAEDLRSCKATLYQKLNLHFYHAGINVNLHDLLWSLT